MRRHAHRVAVLALLLVSGCFGTTPPPDEEERLATPTDRPALIPHVENITANQTPDLTDAGYIVNWTWHVGDEWHYYSNKTRYRLVKVLAETNVSGQRRLIIEELQGVRNNRPDTRSLLWVRPDTFARDNQTFTTGPLELTWSPPNPDWKFLRNGSFGFNETVITSGVTTTASTVRANSFFAGFETIPLMWGRTTVGRVEHRILRTDGGGNIARELVLHYPVREYGNDAQYLTGGDTLWRLIYYKYGDATQGFPATWEN